MKHTQPTEEKGEILRSINNVIVIGAGLCVILFHNLPVAMSRDLRLDGPWHSTAGKSWASGTHYKVQLSLIEQPL